ncbi:MAG: CDP-diacylglycerol--glycerol-3-phosphate 3-phosphatidyltransferase [Gemmatimonadetes bacterium]|nr:CDP-diacylglycerol--glycerol-3-phosphate 3-phosphatidyltransferase [Gemmatimonadota bacterium]
MNTPNKITVARIAVTPLIAWLIYQEGLVERWAAFIVFVVAAVSDVVDGSLARDKGEVTRFGQLLDPIADKMLVLVTIIPLFGLGLVPLWLVILILTREVIITVFRAYNFREGHVIAATRWGKSKALSQNWFVGSLLVLRINHMYTESRGFSGVAWSQWQAFTRGVVEVSLWIVVGLTLLSMVDYLVRHRQLSVGREA